MNTLIVLVDDEESMHDIFRMKFKKEIRANEITIESYFNGKDCEEALLKKCTKELNDIVVLFSDINMPEMDGYLLLEKVKEKYKGIPVVMMSAYDDTQTLEKVKKIGARSLVPKPVDFKQLKEVLLKMKNENA